LFDVGTRSVGSIALVHEWLASRSGSEKTFEQMAVTVPEADLYALSLDPDSGLVFDRPVTTTFLQKSRLLGRRRDLALPAMPLAWKAMSVPEYDVVVTSSHAFSRYFRTGAATHLSYVYTPLRYAWLPGVDARAGGRALGPARAVLRRLDRRTTDGVTAFAGISTVVVDRIQQFYGRDAEVVFPPVDVDFFREPDDVERSDYVLGVSRWIRYKRLDLVIAAAELAGRPAVIAGSGPMEAELRALAEHASVPVTIVRSPTDTQLRRLYRGASVVVFPADEDFGIVPVEAQAADTPVVALRSGGSLDTVLHGSTGMLVEDQDALSFAEAIERAATLRPSLHPDHVEKFSVGTFRTAFRSWIERSVG
jgi:glycosyltransferase involved in cell wall biosynthesis